MAAFLLVVWTGCAVPQPRGLGHAQRITEPTTRRPFYLYLPKDYVAATEQQRAARKWPIVVTFHGMKPFDVAHAQSQEWEQEADRYGYIVIAPILNTFSVLGEFPLRNVNRALQSDEEATLAILNHVIETTHADPGNVLSTSWSSGGYIAHYMLNRHPDRFTCLAVRQSNFSASVLDPGKVSQSLYHPVLILSTENDFGICKKESREAIKWYEDHDYKNFAWIWMNRLGHNRTPDVAADFFARACGGAPNRPSEVLVHRQAIDGNPRGLALLAGNLGSLEQPDTAVAGHDVTPRTVGDDGRPSLARAQRPGLQDAEVVARSRPDSGRGRADGGRRSTARSGPVDISISSTVGFGPLLLVYAAECPSDWHNAAEFCWLLEGEQIGRGLNGQKTILLPGDYRLELVVVTPDGHEYRAERQIRVLREMEATAVPHSSATP